MEANGERLEGKTGGDNISQRAVLFLVQTPLQRGLFFFLEFCCFVFVVAAAPDKRKMTSSALADLG